MTFGRKLKRARTEKHMTQKQLAEMLSVKHNSISNWENDINKPDPNTIELICGVLEITPNYLLSNSPDDFSPSEKLLIKRYRELDVSGKKHIDYELDRETERISELKQKIEHIKELEKSISQNDIHNPNTRLINYYYRLASAGTGQIIFDMPPTEKIEIPDIPEYKKVDYAIGVNGNSMEPEYNDGDTLLIEMAEEIKMGEIGIFLVDNESYVKKLGNGELISLNPEYDNIPLTENSRCMGRVVDKL